MPITPHLDANCLEFGHTLAQSLESEVEPGEEACGSSTDASSTSPDQAPAPFYGRRMSMSCIMAKFVQFCGAQVLVPDDPVNGTSGELPTVAANAEAKSSSEQVCRDLVQSMVLMVKPSSP